MRVKVNAGEHHLAGSVGGKEDKEMVKRVYKSMLA